MLFEIDKELKHFRRYQAAGIFSIETIYVRRPFADNNENLTITVEGFEEDEKEMKILQS